MSVKVMSLVWDNFNRGGSDKLAMLALADWCNDQGGSLHPSVSSVAKKIHLTEKQARVILHRLIEEGWLDVIGNANGGNPGQSRQYVLNIAKLVTTPVEVTPNLEVTPPVEVRDPSRGGSFTPPVDGSLTTSEPSITTSKKTKAKKDPLPLEVLISLGVDEQHAKDWLLVRKTKGAPFTKTALDDVKAQADKAGITIARAVAICAKRNWQGFNATWNWNDDQNARASPVQSIHDKRANTIAELTGANRNERTNEHDITGESIRVA